MTKRGVYKDRTFTGERVVLDGAVYQRCRFERCTLVMEGGAFHLAHCEIDQSCDLAFGGVLADGFARLVEFYQLDQLRPLIDKGVRDILDGSVATSEAPPSYDA